MRDVMNAGEDDRWMEKAADRKQWKGKTAQKVQQ